MSSKFDDKTLGITESDRKSKIFYKSITLLFWCILEGIIVYASFWYTYEWNKISSNKWVMISQNFTEYKNPANKDKFIAIQ